MSEAVPSRSIQGRLLFDKQLYDEVVLQRLAHARESVWIATANVKTMMVERAGAFVPLVEVLSDLSRRGVALRLLHAEVPSRPFRTAFDRCKDLVSGGLELKICPRVHFKCVIVDGAWIYVGSANLTGAGLGAKSADRRNFELGLCTEDFDVIDRVSALFEAIWQGKPCRSCQLYSVCPDPIGEPPPGRRRARRGRRTIGGMWRER